MQDYNFFKTLNLVDTGRTRPPKTNIPEGMTVRVMANGKVYPSKELTEKYNLEYKPTGTSQGNGIDVIDTKKWAAMPKEHPRAILFGITSKTLTKVDLFASCRYNDDGTPKSSVLAQGAVDEHLLALVKEFGWLTEEQTYVDLTLLEEFGFKTQDGIANIPKTIAKGPNAGKDSYVRREDVMFYPVHPTDLKSIVEKTEQVTAETVAEEVGSNELVTN